jgi:peptidoglycan/xylan/chitin deacetylase (PgdA/CDA1 family)
MMVCQRFTPLFSAAVFAILGCRECAHCAPVVIFKMDDLRASSTPSGLAAAWDRLFDYVDAKPLTVSVGIIGNSLESTIPAYPESIRRIHATGRVEFWNHGYLHVRDQPPGTYEFKGTTLTYQQTNFQTTQSLARERLGFSFATFGAPYNASDATTRQVLEVDPDMQISLYGTTAIFGPTVSRLLNLERWLNLEVSAGIIVDYNTFVANYQAQRQRPYLVLQGHPVSWDLAEFDTFTRIVDFLIADGVTFMTPSGYRAGMDSDHDGVPDVIERILGRDPALAESAPPIALDLQAGLLAFELAASQPAKPRLAAEFSNNLGSWSKLTIAPAWITTLPGGRRRIEIPVSLAPQRTLWRLAESSDGIPTWP